MNKLTRLITLLTVLVLATVTYAQSESDQGIANNDLINLASYVEEDTDLFITLRTDDAYIEKLTGFLYTIADNWGLPKNMLDVRSAIYDIVSVPFGNKQNMEAWLGDHIALSVSSLDVFLGNSPENIPTVIYSIISQTEADAYINEVYSTTIRRITFGRNVRENGVIQYNIEESGDTYYIQITDDLLIISSEFDYINTLSDDRLSDDDGFKDLVDHFPQDAYDLIGYVDAGVIIDSYNNIAYGYSAEYDELRMQIDDDLIDKVGFALNIYDDRTIVIDFVAEVDEEYIHHQPIDRDLIRFVPSNALFVSHTTALSSSVGQYNTAFSQAYSQFENFGGGFDDEIPFDVKHFLTFMDQVFKGTTGVTSEEFAEGLESDWLFYVSTVGNTANFLNIIRSSDRDKTDPVFNHVMDAIQDVFKVARYEEDILKVSLPANPVFGDQEIWMGQRDDLYVVGTQHNFRFEPDPTSVTLNTRRPYNYASQYFLSDLNGMFYVNFTQIRSFLDVIRQRSNERDAREISEVINFLGGIESIYSTTSHSDEYVQARFAITFTDPTTR